MSLNSQSKQAIVSALSEIAQEAVSAVVADYRGLTAPDMTALRRYARQSGVKVQVYRNTLARRALEGTPFSCLKEKLAGPVVFLFSIEEPGAAARVLRDFMQSHNALLKVCGLALDGTMLPGSQLLEMASLPSKEEALVRLLMVMQAPLVQYLRTLKEPFACLVRAVTAVGYQKKAVNK